MRLYFVDPPTYWGNAPKSSHWDSVERPDRTGAPNTCADRPFGLGYASESGSQIALKQMGLYRGTSNNGRAAKYFSFSKIIYIQIDKINLGKMLFIGKIFWKNPYIRKPVEKDMQTKCAGWCPQKAFKDWGSLYHLSPPLFPPLSLSLPTHSLHPIPSMWTQPLTQTTPPGPNPSCVLPSHPYCLTLRPFFF